VDEAIVVAIVSSLGSGLLGALISGIVTLRTAGPDLKAKYDSEVRAKRIEQYTTILVATRSYFTVEIRADHKGRTLEAF
jgi:hypothetical protein